MPESFPTGFYNNMAQQMTGLNEKLAILNENLTIASASTEKLARALNWLTGAGAFVGLLSVIVAAIDMVHRWQAV